MEIVSIVLSGISVLIGIVVLLIALKMKNQKENSKLTENDLSLIRKSVSESVNNLSESISKLIAEQNKGILEGLNKDINMLNESMNALVLAQKELNKDNGEFQKNILEANAKIKEEIMDKLSKEMKDFNEKMSESVEKLTLSVNTNLKEMREDNSAKLEKINESVNDKLQKTLEDKLKNSFDNVIKQISNVNEAVGEIKGLANDVGSLKNVLTNVKTKGITGEIILGNIIKEYLEPNQYEENVVTKKNSTERVEFAIKLPGKKDDVPVYLPIDSKFPYEAYSHIVEANSKEEADEYRKLLRQGLLKYADDVNKKYIDSPNTTDFAIIFLPLEGLYLEAIQMGLFEEIQRKYKVNLTGPTTLSAFINALQMGFKSLMIQKKSVDVFNLLEEVKKEFGNFADALETTQKKMNDVSDNLEKLVGTRTRMMNSKLKKIDKLDIDLIEQKED